MQNRLASLDLLRFYGALSVLTYHYFGVCMRPEYGAVIAPQLVVELHHFGYLGVQLFFVISGYVITLSAEDRSRAAFAVARWIRLWPTFLLALALTAVGFWASGSPPKLKLVIANMTMVPSLFSQERLDNVYWTLQIEIAFYAAIALLAIGANFILRLRMLSFGMLVISQLIYVLPSTPITQLLAMPQAPYFAVGVAIYLLRRPSKLIWDYLLLATALIVAFVTTVRIYPGGGAFHDGHAWIAAGIVMLYAGLVFAAPSVTLGRPLSRLAFILGGISYPLYLIHNQFGLMLGRRIVAHSGSLTLWLVTVAMLILSYVIWRIEYPMPKAFWDWYVAKPKPTAFAVQAAT